MIALKRVARNGRGCDGDQEFIARYRKGRPWEGYADPEVLDRYRQVAARLTPAEFEQAARDAVARLSPQDRQLFARYLQQQAWQHGLQIADLDGNDAEDRFRDAAILGTILARIRCRREAELEHLIGAQGDRFDSLLAKGVLAGIVATALSARPA